MKYIFRTLIAFSLVIFASCEDKLTDLSIDKDAVIIANDSEVLTSAQGYLGIFQDVDLNEGPSFMWAQYYTWGIGVSIGNDERYVAEPDDQDGYWQRAYANCLEDLEYLSKSESAAYRGVSKILKAYVFQALVDHFGNVPYSEALKGESEGVLTPSYDDAAAIYADLIVSLDAALEELEFAKNDPTDIGMDTDDLVYGGDLDKWTKFANSLKLRILMRTSETAPKGTEIIALISTGEFLETAADLAEISWPGVTGNENPMYATQISGVGDFYFASSATVDLLVNLSDPRLDYFYSAATTGPEAGNIRAICQGCVDRDVPFTDPASDYSGSSPYANGPAVSTILMSHWEVWFLRAEAAARYNTADDDEAAFTAAITSNFSHIGAPGEADYISSLGYSSAPNMDGKIDLIAIQKWISFNGTQEDEGWIETRRLDRPASRVFTGGIFQTPPLSVLAANTFPASWLYPASEVSFNSGNVPAQRKITDRLFWDN